MTGIAVAELLRCLARAHDVDDTVRSGVGPADAMDNHAWQTRAERGAVPHTRSQHGQAIIKGVIDCVGSAVGLILSLPLMLVIAGVIRLDSPGRAVFIQRRIGKDGRPFMVYKFRTMVQDAEELLHSSPEMQKQYRKSFKLGEDDSRLTRFGRILRRTSMDELPQLINVLRGEMSLVGPRPREEEEVQEHFVGLESKLLSVKPGITGYWQVRGRNGIDYPKRVDVELYYIDNRSLRLDLAILGWTVTAVLTGRGAV